MACTFFCSLVINVKQYKLFFNLYAWYFPDYACRKLPLPAETNYSLRRYLANLQIHHRMLQGWCFTMFISILLGSLISCCVTYTMANYRPYFFSSLIFYDSDNYVWDLELILIQLVLCWCLMNAVGAEYVGSKC